MTDWPVKTLGEVCDLVGGGTPSKDRLEFYGGEIPWATVRDLNVEVLRTTEHSITAEAVKSSSSNIIPAGSVVIATRVGLGKAVKIAQDTAINQDLRGLVVKKPKELIADYLYWWYLSTVHLVVAAGTGATVQGVKLPFVSGLAIPVPPLEEQKRIVALLDAATARVGELTACYEQARTHANNLFTSALSDALGSNSDWPVKTLGEIGSIKGGKRLPKGTPWSSVRTGHPYIRATDIRDGEVRTDNLVFVPEEIWPVISRYTVKEGDVLVTIAGTIGSVAVVPKELAEANFTENAAKVTNLVDVEPSYLSCFLRSAEVKDRLESLATTTTQAKLALFRIESIKIPVPPLEEQKRIVERLDLMREKTSEMVTAYDAKLTAAKNLRQSILEAAFAGDL